uniref:RING-type domain-containing protein n=1 Tax=Xenopus tropicalis TaxID=8364 RepID=A0A1B8Y1R9_XENTR
MPTEVAIAGVKADLTCPLCREIYTDPVTLPCGHNICLRCIGGTGGEQGERGEDPSCPECKERYRRCPKLNRNIRLHNIVQSFLPTHPEQESARILCTYCATPVPAAKCCLQYVVFLCDRHAREHRNSLRHILMDYSTLLNNAPCSTHQKPLGYYCREDAACVCEDCVPEHRWHIVEKLDVETEKVKEQLRILQGKLLTFLYNTVMDHL